MLIKRSTAEITKVLDDEEHDLDDDGTRKALAQAKKKKEEFKKISNESESAEDKELN